MSPYFCSKLYYIHNIIHQIIIYTIMYKFIIDISLYDSLWLLTSILGSFLVTPSALKSYYVVISKHGNDSASG